LKFFRRIADRKSNIWVIALLAIFLVPSFAGTIEPTVVTLLYFRGVGLNNAIRLEWATGTEFGTVGFRLERSNSSVGPFLILDDIGFVPSEAPPDGLSGADYDAIDESGTTNGTTFWYRLVEIEGSGAENRTDPISVTAGLAQPTSTPSSTPENTPSVASTAGPTVDPETSSTPISTVQSGTATIPPSTPIPGSTADTEASPSSGPEATRLRKTELASAAGEDPTVSDSPFGSASIQSTASGYPAPDGLSTPLPNPQIGDEGYPGISQDDILGLPDAYPFPLENTRQARALDPQNELSSASGPTAIGQANSNDSNIGPVQSEQEPVATLILWVGFLASLVIFIAGVVGSAYIYRRQNRK